MVLGACPRGSRVVRAEYFRKEYVPGPIQVAVRTPDESERILVIRLARHGSVEDEAHLLPILARLGLPVPEVLAGPEEDPDLPGNPLVALYTLLPGVNLQELSEGSVEDCKLAAKLVVDAATWLAEVTPMLRVEPEADFLHTVTLCDRLDMIVDAGGPWLGVDMFGRAVERLRPVLKGVAEAPVFTGGDNQPANFLTDGEGISGFVDFEMASYQDFLFGFAKYPIYDLHPLNKAGLISYLMNEKGFSSEEFHIRVALGCLATLQREIPLNGGDHEYRSHVIDLLTEALEKVCPT